MQEMPVLFIGHGNPMNAIEDNEYRRSWQQLGASLTRPEAVLCISAHWETRGVCITGAEQPDTIHDFFGFPQTLFDVRYPAPGNTLLAEHVSELLADYDCQPEPERGFDHGAWSVLAPMFPEADIPVLQLSLASAQPPAWHWELARKLAPLRAEGVLILASGNIVHNIGLFDRSSAKPPAYDWALDFNGVMCRALERGDAKTLCNYRELSGIAQLAVPTPEHFLPLVYAAAQRQDDDELKYFNNDVLSSISMTSFVLG